MNDPERTTHPTAPAQVKAGDLMTLIHYVKVKSVRDAGRVLLVQDLDDDNKEIQVTGEGLVTRALSADQVHEEHKITKTAMAEMLMVAFNTPFTVCFTKEDGMERVLRGRLVAPESVFGRSRVEDLDRPATDRLRLVTHSKLKWLILEGVKYTVK